MLFKNAHSTAISFSICKRQFDVPVGAEVEVPDEWAHYVASRGILLEKVPMVKATVSLKAEDAKDPEKVADALSKATLTPDSKQATADKKK